MFVGYKIYIYKDDFVKVISFNVIGVIYIWMMQLIVYCVGIWTVIFTKYYITLKTVLQKFSLSLYKKCVRVKNSFFFRNSHLQCFYFNIIHYDSLRSCVLSAYIACIEWFTFIDTYGILIDIILQSAQCKVNYFMWLKGTQSCF